VVSAYTGMLEQLFSGATMVGELLLLRRVEIEAQGHPSEYHRRHGLARIV
jgi:hypothetical protein